MTAPNAALAYRALDTARAAGRLNMGEWVDGPASLVGLAELTNEESCGTTACLAGWAVALAGYKVSCTGVAFDQAGLGIGHVQRVATDLLGITHEDSEFLFFVDDDDLDEAMKSVFGPRPVAELDHSPDACLVLNGERCPRCVSLFGPRPGGEGGSSEATS